MDSFFGAMSLAKSILGLSICLITTNLWAQVNIERQLYSTTGSSDNAGGSIVLSYSIGEAVITTENSVDYLLTQGFHQPLSMGPLDFDLALKNTSCAYLSDGNASINNIRGCVPPYSISWSTGDSGLINTSLSEGNYTVTVSASDCELTKTFSIVKGPENNCGLIFYNVFSPNPDLINNNWIIDNINLGPYQDNSVEIFNRWGTMVWSGKNYDNMNVVFSGNARSGKSLPDGTYFFICKANAQVFKGYIEITR